MQRLRVGIIVLAVTATAGCPSEFGKNGRIAKAVHQDAQDQLVLTRCSEKRKREVCEGPQRDAKKCRDCGG